MKRVLTDTLATIVFFTTIATLTELYIAGLDPLEVLKTRMIMIPMMVVTGRPYGIWRDLFFHWIKPVAAISRTLVDGAAFLSFQLPVYGVTLAIAGADGAEIFTLLATTSVLMFLVSRPFGLFLEMVRRLARVPSA